MGCHSWSAPDPPATKAASGSPPQAAAPASVQLLPGMLPATAAPPTLGPDAVRTRDAYTPGVDPGRIGPYRRPIAPKDPNRAQRCWWAGAESNCHSRRRGFYSSRSDVRRRPPSPVPRTNRPSLPLWRPPVSAPIATGVATQGSARAAGPGSATGDDEIDPCAGRSPRRAAWCARTGSGSGPARPGQGTA